MKHSKGFRAHNHHGLRCDREQALDRCRKQVVPVADGALVRLDRYRWQHRPHVRRGWAAGGREDRMACRPAELLLLAMSCSGLADKPRTLWVSERDRRCMSMLELACLRRDVMID